MMQRSIPLADRFPFAPRRWSSLLAGVAVALTLVSSAPAEAGSPMASLNFNLTTETDEQLQQRVHDVFDSAFDFAVDTLLTGDVNCDEGVDGGCHFSLCCVTSTGNCIQEITCVKTSE